MIFFQWPEVTSLLAQTHSGASRIETSNQLHVHSSILTRGAPPLLLVFDQIKVLVAVAIQRADQIL